ncbi:MAG: mannose-1-phosphate guanylyltransferase [Armatimonadetes bacterium]|nr:mannose-1-phosphate guanylyltransferase [Armatimonadota bacterium]
MMGAAGDLPVAPTGPDAADQGARAKGCAVHYLIMAGGSGTRLWPMSRRAEPKQFQPLLGERSLIQETYDRLRPLAEPDRIFVATTRELTGLCREHLPELPAGNILVEPAARNTGPAIGMAAAALARRDPEAVLATVHADHVIGRPEVFRQALLLGGQEVTRHPERLVTIGLRPTWGNPGFGYIRVGGSVPDELAVLPVERFVEKPDRDTAARYVAAGCYLWNAGYFVFRVRTVLEGIARYNPGMAAGLAQIEADPAQLDRLYPTLDSVPVDTLLFEPESLAGRVVTIPAALEWDDLGSWKTLLDVLAARSGSDVVTRGEVVAVDCRRTLVHGGSRLVALVGVEDLVVVDTPDALLICRAERSEGVRDVLARLPADDPRR